MVDTATSQKRLLVVDDDYLICWALEREFSAHGLAASHCHLGNEALGKVRAAAFDVVILDVNLPDSNGIAILREIGRMSPGTRVIVISADAEADNVRGAIAAGAEQFFEKPFDPSTLRAHVLDMFRDYSVPRRDPRHLCRFPVQISLLAPLPAGAGADIGHLDGIVENVGPGGCRVATDFPLAAGQLVRVKADGDDRAAPFVHLLPPDAAAEVRWTTMAPGGFQAGLGFTRPSLRQGASPEGAA